MRKRARICSRIFLGIVIAALVPVIAYIAIVARAWMADSRETLAEPAAGQSDFSRLARARPGRTIVPEADPVRAIDQLRTLVQQTAAQHGKITVAGSRHSMGGHTLLDGSLSIDMRCDGFRHIDAVSKRDSLATVRVGAGATWHQVLTALDREGWSVAVMQSNDDFTVGGSISVNCHGWQPNSPPIASTVEGFRILLADGSVRECRRDRDEDRELFAAVCGGYGLLGIILDVDLRVVPNALYRAEEFHTDAANFAQQFDKIVSQSADNSGLAYGRVSIAPGPWFLRDARIVRFVRINPDTPDDLRDTLDNPKRSLAPKPWEIGVARAAFRASVASVFGKLGRWTVERFHGQTHRVVSRNGILRTPSDWFANRDAHFTEILHEYFVPPKNLAAFLNQIRPVLQHTGDVDFLNVTLRPVEADNQTILRYARNNEVGLVMLFRYRATTEADAQMGDITRRLIDAALANDGSYYLPYRPHATIEQFRRAYPQCGEFYRVKKKYDPEEIFDNSFYRDYIAPAAK